MEETFKAQLRKKVLDLKIETQGFYTELYNLVAVMIRLNPDAFNKGTADLLDRKMHQIYHAPSSKYLIGLPQFEQLLFTHKDDPNVKIRSKIKIDMSDVKTILDKVRRDLLFYLALVEDRPKDYNIVLEKAAKETNHDPYHEKQ